MSKRRDLIIRRKVKAVAEENQVAIGRQYFNAMCSVGWRRRFGLAARILFKRKLAE